MGRAPGAIVALGTVVGAYGVHGWLRVKPHTEVTDMLLQYAKWWLKPAGGGDWREYARIDGRTHSGFLLAQLTGVGSREDAAAMKGSEVGIPRAAMARAPEGEIYWEDLIGLSVINRDGVLLGAVSGVTEHGAHPLLRVASPGSSPRERLIPYVPAIVDGVHLDAGRIDVDWGEDY